MTRKEFINKRTANSITAWYEKELGLSKGDVEIRPVSRQFPCTHVRIALSCANSVTFYIETDLSNCGIARIHNICLEGRRLPETAPADAYYTVYKFLRTTKLPGCSLIMEEGFKVRMCIRSLIGMSDYLGRRHNCRCVDGFVAWLVENHPEEVSLDDNAVVNLNSDNHIYNATLALNSATKQINRELFLPKKSEETP